MERTRATKASTFFGVPREAKDTDENGPAQEEEEGEGTLVSTLPDEPPPKRSKTIAANVDIVEKVCCLFHSLSCVLATALNP
jgi:hypothetical protein